MVKAKLNRLRVKYNTPKNFNRLNSRFELYIVRLPVLLLKNYPDDARAYYIVGGNLLSVDHPKAMEMLHRPS